MHLSEPLCQGPTHSTALGPLLAFKPCSHDISMKVHLASISHHNGLQPLPVPSTAVVAGSVLHSQLPPDAREWDLEGGIRVLTPESSRQHQAQSRLSVSRAEEPARGRAFLEKLGFIWRNEAGCPTNFNLNYRLSTTNSSESAEGGQFQQEKGHRPHAGSLEEEAGGSLTQRSWWTP